MSLRSDDVVDDVIAAGSDQSEANDHTVLCIFKMHAEGKT